jgi:hypothetical protein
MASVDLIAVVGAAFFGGGILVGAMLVIAAGIRAEGQLAWRRGTATLRDDPASRMARGIRRINGVGLRSWGPLPAPVAPRMGEAGGRPTGAGRPTPAEPMVVEDLGTRLSSGRD